MSIEKVSPSSLTIKYVSADDDGSIEKVTSIITHAFWNAPLMPAFIVEQDDLQPPYPQHISFERRLDHFENGISNLAKNGAITVYAGDFSAMAIWIPPGYSGPGFGDSRKRTSPLTLELGTKLTAVEHRLFAIPGQVDDKGQPKMRPTWHLQFLARNPDPHVENVQGGISAVVKPYLQKAIEDNIPACLEATTERNVQIYKHFGFRVEEVVRMGVGRLAADGWPQDGGPGVSIWVMIFDGHLQ